MCLSPFLLSVPSPPDFGHTLYLARRRRRRSRVPSFPCLAGFFLTTQPGTPRYCTWQQMRASAKEAKTKGNRCAIQKQRRTRKQKGKGERRKGSKGGEGEASERGGPRRVSLYYRINQQSGSDGASSEVPLGGERPREAEEGRCAAAVDTTYLGAIARR